MEGLGQLIRLKVGDFVNDNPHELLLTYNFEVASSVSAIMIRPIIDVLGSDEQKAKWNPLLKTYRTIGCYAQTELGHGSDVQNLETEAIFDESSQEIILNNPTVNSYKWWPGELGVNANMAVVYAMLKVNGKKMGVFPFIAQIRDFDTHELLEGVEAGDIGPKLGYHGKDNGYLKFTNF